MADDDIKLHNYQDDLDTDVDSTDPVMEEETDDPTKELGVPPDIYKDELDKLDFGDDSGDGDDDMRERIEDEDEDASYIK
jgi:hypothetical protein